LNHTIDGARFRRMVISAAAAVENKMQQINELNVFPVPDGDTGTNMSMTLNAAANDLRKGEENDLGKVSSIVSSALLRGARGNSGVILSLLFRGFSKEFKGKTEADGAAFAAAIGKGVEAAYKAVMRPAEGTILTVARVSAAAAAEEAEENCDIEHILVFLVDACRNAVAETVNQNPVLQKAGVVDAGGQGFLVALEGMLSSLRGNDITASAPAGNVKTEADFSDFSTEDITFGYCTEFIVNRENDKDPELLRPFLNTLGDSLVLVADEEIIKVHVHTNHPGLVIEEALTYGGLATSKIENMRIPIAGPIIRKIGFIPLDRDNPLRAMRSIHAAARLVSQKGYTMGIYPEGTRSRTEELLEFKIGAFVLAKKAKAPLVITRITGTRSYRGRFPFRSTPVTFEVLEVLDAEAVADQKPEELAEYCRNRISNH